MGNKKGYSLIWILMFVIIIICLIPVCETYYSSAGREKKQDLIKRLHRADQVEEMIQAKREENDPTLLPENFLSAATPKNRFVRKDPIILDQYAALYEENNDLTGWLSIEGMVIDYPVMQCEDNEYYLHHNFDRKEDKHGCLFVNSIADVDTPGTNFIIYGHNMKDGSMFGDLDLYREESFYLEHPTISFDTLYEERTYEIVAVFLSRIYKENENAFEYYRFYSAKTEREFDIFYENIKALSLYDTGVTAEFGDTFLTLSTCAYHVTDGRLAIVAKRVK